MNSEICCINDFIKVPNEMMTAELCVIQKLIPWLFGSTIDFVFSFLYLTWAQHWAPAINFDCTARFGYFCDPLQFISSVRWTCFEPIVIWKLSLHQWFWPPDGFSRFWHGNRGWLGRDPRTPNWLLAGLGTIRHSLRLIFIFNLGDSWIFPLPPRNRTISICRIIAPIILCIRVKAFATSLRMNYLVWVVLRLINLPRLCKRT